MATPSRTEGRDLKSMMSLLNEQVSDINLISSNFQSARANSIRSSMSAIEKNNEQFETHVREMSERHKKEVESKAKHYEDIISKLKHDLSEKEGLLDVLRGRLDKCRTAKQIALEELMDTRKKYDERVEELEDAIMDSRVKLKELQQEIKRRESESEKMEELRVKLIDTQADLRASKNSLENLEDNCRENEDAKKKLIEEKRKLEENIKVLMEENESLRKQLLEYVDKVKSKSESETFVQNILNQQISQLQTELEDTKNTLSKEEAKASSLENQLETLRKDYNLLKVDVRILNRNKTDLQNLISERESEMKLLHEKITTMEDRTSSLSSQVTELERSSQTLKHQLNAKENDYTSVVAIKDILEEQKAQLESDLLAVKKELQKKDLKLQDNGNLQSLLEHKELIISEMDKQLRIKDVKLQTAHANVETLKDCSIVLDKQLEDFQAALQEKAAKFADCQKMGERLEKENKELREKLCKVKIELNEAKSLKSFTENRLELHSNLHSESESKESVLHDVMERLSFASKRNVELSEEVSSLTAQVICLEGENVDLRKELESVKIEKERIAKDMNSCIKTVVDLKDENISLKNALDESKENAESYRKKCATLENRLVMLQASAITIKNTLGTPVSNVGNQLVLQNENNKDATPGATPHKIRGRMLGRHQNKVNPVTPECFEEEELMVELEDLKRSKFKDLGNFQNTMSKKTPAAKEDKFSKPSEPVSKGEDDDVRRRRFVKVRSDKMTVAEALILVIEDGKLKMYEEEENGKQGILVDVYPLNKKTTVSFRVKKTENLVTVKEEIAFAMKVTFYNDQDEVAYLYMFHKNKRQKRYWTQAILQYTEQGAENTMPSDNSFNDDDDNENQLSPKINQKLLVHESCRTMYVNCAHYVPSSPAYILGCEDGLYSVKELEAEMQIVKIEGPTEIHDIGLLDGAKLVIFIEGADQTLTLVNLDVLKTCAEAASCSNPKLTTKVVRHTKQCYKLATRSETLDDTTVAAAGSNGLFLCKMFCGQLTVIKQFLTDDKITSILMTPQSVFFGNNEVFQLDTKTLKHKAFLDHTDEVIIKMIKEKTDGFPVAILDVSQSRAPDVKVEEYLICFQHVGIFVNRFGRHSREVGVRWSHVPRALQYKHPYLFIIYFNVVEIRKLDDRSYRKVPATSSQESDLVLPVSRFSKVESKSKHFIFHVGDGSQGVIISLNDAKAVKVLEIFAS